MANWCAWQKRQKLRKRQADIGELSLIHAVAVGFTTGFSLILAIAAQNAFVLRQRLLQRHVFDFCLLCALLDAILIAAGHMNSLR